MPIAPRLLNPLRMRVCHKNKAKSRALYGGIDVHIYKPSAFLLKIRHWQPFTAKCLFTKSASRSLSAASHLLSRAMKKAALSINQSFQHQTFALMPSGDRGLQVLQGPRLRGNASTAVVTPAQPETCKPDCPTAQSSKASMNSDAGTESAPTPLAAAIARNDIDTLKALIKAGTDLRPANWYDTPVLVTAVEKGFVEIVKILVAARANVNNGYEQLPLGSAAKHGHLQIVQLLLAAGANLEAQNAQGYTALTAAAATGQLNVVRFLVEAGAQLKTTPLGETALSLAAKGGHQSVYEFLHSKIAPAVKKTPSETPLTKAYISVSVMDEMIDSTTAELKELLSDANVGC